MAEGIGLVALGLGGRVPAVDIVDEVGADVARLVGDGVPGELEVLRAGAQVGELVAVGDLEVVRGGRGPEVRHGHGELRGGGPGVAEEVDGGHVVVEAGPAGQPGPAGGEAAVVGEEVHLLLRLELGLAGEAEGPGGGPLGGVGGEGEGGVRAERILRGGLPPHRIAEAGLEGGVHVVGGLAGIGRRRGELFARQDGQGVHGVGGQLGSRGRAGEGARRHPVEPVPEEEGGLLAEGGRHGPAQPQDGVPAGVAHGNGRQGGRCGEDERGAGVHGDPADDAVGRRGGREGSVRLADFVGVGGRGGLLEESVPGGRGDGREPPAEQAQAVGEVGVAGGVVVEHGDLLGEAGVGGLAGGLHGLEETVHGLLDGRTTGPGKAEAAAEEALDGPGIGVGPHLAAVLVVAPAVGRSRLPEDLEDAAGEITPPLALEVQVGPVRVPGEGQPDGDERILRPDGALHGADAPEQGEAEERAEEAEGPD